VKSAVCNHCGWVRNISKGGTGQLLIHLRKVHEIEAAQKKVTVENMKEEEDAGAGDGSGKEGGATATSNKSAETVWQHFSPCEVMGKKKAVCKHCGSMLSIMRTGNGVLALLTHLRKRHNVMAVEGVLKGALVEDTTTTEETPAPSGSGEIAAYAAAAATSEGDNTEPEQVVIVPKITVGSATTKKPNKATAVVVKPKLTAKAKTAKAAAKAALEAKPKVEVTVVKEEAPDDDDDGDHGFAYHLGEYNEDEVGQDGIPDFGGDYDALLDFVKIKMDDDIITQANLKRKILELTSQVKALQNKSKGRKQFKLPPHKMAKKDRHEIVQHMLKSYFSEGQIAYLLQWSAKKREGNQADKPHVQWSDEDVNRFARLQAQIRMAGYQYLRRCDYMPMPSINVIQRAGQIGKLTPETLAFMDEKMRGRNAPKSVPKSGLPMDDRAENPFAVNSNSTTKPKATGAVTTSSTSSAASTAAKNAAASAANKRQIGLVMAAIQANNIPSIIVRKRQPGTMNFQETALYTPTPGTRTGTWNDADFDTIAARRTITGYTRTRPTAAGGGGGGGDQVATPPRMRGRGAGTATSAAAKRKRMKMEEELDSGSSTDDEDDTELVQQYEDEAGGTATLYGHRTTSAGRKNAGGQITIVEQQAAIDSISGGAAAETAAVTAGKHMNQFVLQTTTAAHGVHQTVPVTTRMIGGQEVMLVATSAEGQEGRGGGGEATFAIAPEQFQGQQVVYAADGQLLQSYQTVSYTTQGTAAAAAAAADGGSFSRYDTASSSLV